MAGCISLMTSYATLAAAKGELQPICPALSNWITCQYAPAVRVFRRNRPFSSEIVGTFFEQKESSINTRFNVLRISNQRALIYNVRLKLKSGTASLGLCRRKLCNDGASYEIICFIISRITIQPGFKSTKPIYLLWYRYLI